MVEKGWDLFTLGGGELLRLLSPSCAALLRYCHNVVPDADGFITEKWEDKKRGIFFIRKRLTA